MYEIAPGLIFSDELNKLIYSTEYIINSGLNLDEVSNVLGDYAEYISENEKDLLYARSTGISIFNENVRPFNYNLSHYIDVDKEIEFLKELNPNIKEKIDEEYDYIKKHKHNLLLLRISFILKKHLDNISTGVYLMRGSGVSSIIFYAIGLNKVNPSKFGLDYRNFWK